MKTLIIALFGTGLLLALAALVTSFPHQFSTQSQTIVFASGIILLALSAVLALIHERKRTRELYDPKR